MCVFVCMHAYMCASMHASACVRLRAWMHAFGGVCARSVSLIAPGHVSQPVEITVPHVAPHVEVAVLEAAPATGPHSPITIIAFL